MLQEHEYEKSKHMHSLSGFIKYKVILSGKGEQWKGKYKPSTALSIHLPRQ